MQEPPSHHNQKPGPRPPIWLGVALAVSGLLFFACLLMFLLAMMQ